ncbi:MAG: DNA translocase FtsK [Duncaniella sp.]|nr:DNA translocase FtsK [Duncaniella sp.]
MASNPYSPIDESSYSENTSYDPEAILNRDVPGHYTMPSSTRISEQNVEEPMSPSSTPPQPEQLSDAPATQAHRAEPSSKTSRNSNVSGISKAWALARDSRTVMFMGLVFVAFAAYALIVSISYFANIGNDQSAMLNYDYAPEMIKNAGGPFGAWLAHTLLYNWLGIGSFILIYYLAVCGLSMLRVYRPNFWSLTLNCLLTAISLSVVCGLVTYEIASPIYWGGRHGHFLNERLITFTGIWGALGVSIIMIGMVIFLYLTKLKIAIGFVSGKYGIYKARQDARRAERRRIEEEEEARRAEEERNAEIERQAEMARKAEEARRAEALRQAEEEARKTESERIANEKLATEQAEKVLPTTPVETIVDSEEEVKSDIATIESENHPLKPIFNDPQDSEESMIEDEADNDDIDEIEPLFASSEEKQETSLFPVAPVSATNETQPTPPVTDIRPELYDPRAELSRYKFPDIELLRASEDKGVTVDVQEMEFNKHRITETLKHYGVEISHIEATIGPTVTLYEIIPAEGVRTRSVKSLGDDLQLSLAALGVRIIAPIPAKGTIGIEVPNKDPQVVSMRSVIDSEEYKNCKMELPMALGRTISNDIFMADLSKMPHLLVAGATGMGKSVGLNAIITSLLYKKHPSELKFVLIDPKRVELSLYRKLERHFLAALPGEDAIITDMSKVVTVLNSLCVEMDNRLSLLEQAGARNIKEYNEKFIARKLNPETHHFLPYIVLIIDEFADLIIRQGKEIENPVSRLAAVARAAGIHLIIATQRPTVNVITGGIKLNIPGRIAFRVIQGNDSRTILDQLGANQLIGRGDMLFSINGKLERVQCAFIDTPEVSDICESIAEQVGYSHPYELPEYAPEGDGGSFTAVGDRDPLFDEAARFVVSTDTASTSSLQRRYSIGYNRAGKIMDQMEAAGIVGPSQGGKPRQVLVDPITLEHILDNN